MRVVSWLKRHGTCRIQTRSVGEWKILEVRGKFFAGEPEKLFRNEVDAVLKGGARRLVVDLSRSLLSDESIASVCPEAYHKAKHAGADIRFVVMPGRAGGFYHMAGLELAIPTYTRLGGAIEF